MSSVFGTVALALSLVAGLPGLAAATHKPFILLGVYPDGSLQLPAMINQIHAINSWIASTGKRIMIAGDFMDPEFPNPDFNVPAELGGKVWNGTAFEDRGAWPAGFVPFVNLTYFGGGGTVPQRSSTDIANGLADARTRQWAREFAKWSNGGQKRAFLAPLPEANFPEAPYHQGGPEDFKRAFRRIRTIFEEELTAAGVPLTAISWVFAPNNGSPPGHDFELYYPGPDVVDIVGFSAYNMGGCPGNEPWFIWDSFETAMRPYLDRMRAMAPNRPIFITQTASLDRPAHGVGDKDAWLEDTYKKLAGYPGVKGVIYYNVDHPNTTPSCPDGLDFRVHVPEANPDRWEGFPRGLAAPEAHDYGDYPLSSAELVNLVFARPPYIFTDVVPNHPLLGADGSTDFSPWINALYEAGITGGCGTNPLRYCPAGPVTRGQMAVFMMRGLEGGNYVPPPPTGDFADVPIGHTFAGWIEAFADAGITGGCGTSPRRFCPDDVVTRGQMAIFLLRAKHGAGYTPPPATGTMFADVPATHAFANWIEQLASEGVTGGCGTNPLRYCPNAGVTRQQMAVFLVRVFEL